MNTLIPLYKLSEEYEFLIQNLYNEETGELDEVALKELDKLNDTIENKCINVTRFFTSIKATYEAIKAEKERLSKREKTFKKQVEWVKEYLKLNMERCNIKKIECPEFSISLRKNQDSLFINNEDLIPSEYEKPQKRELDNAKIKADLQNGVVIPGAFLVKNNSVQIR
jgi:hypothetical protein